MEIYRIVIPIIGLLFVSCSNKDTESYYSALMSQREAQVQAHKDMEDDMITLECESKCRLVATRPKMPLRFQRIEKPKSTSDTVLQYLGVLAPTTLGIAGLITNYKIADSNNDMTTDMALSRDTRDSRMFEAMKPVPVSGEPNVDNSVVNTYDYSQQNIDDNSYNTDSYNTNSGDDYTSNRNPIDDNSDNSMVEYPQVK